MLITFPLPDKTLFQSHHLALPPDDIPYMGFEREVGIMYRNTAILAVLAGRRPDRMGFCGEDDHKPSTGGPPTDSGRPTDWGLVKLVCMEETLGGRS